jgi:lysyl-tRNA synthetase class 2
VGDDDLTATRRAKLAKLRAGGPAYPNGFRPTEAAGDLQRAHAGDDAPALEALARGVCVAGRLVGRRSFGRAVFAVLEDVTGCIQLYLREDRLDSETFALVKTLDLGDRVGVRGTLFRTRTGELTVAVDSLVLLAKCLHPLPEKWHGLTDIEVRYRQRYLDLIANREVRQVFVQRARIFGILREFLGERGFVEVETPILQTVAGGAAARPFLTRHNALQMDLQLRIAPELFLKRLLVGGFERVFEIGRNFRNEGLSTQHNPEFTMLEFYQSYATYEDLMGLLEELFERLAREIHGSTDVSHGDRRIELKGPWRRIDLLGATAERAGCSPADLRDPVAARKLAERHAVPVMEGQGAGAIATALFERLVEPELIDPTFVTGFPAEVSPLARPSDTDPFLVDRFELYALARETANGFSELNDPDEQRARFLQQLESRALGDQEAHPMDEDYVTALEYGMPPAAGCGVGIDRLVMLLCDLPSIRDVMLFPLLRPELKP